MTSVIHSGSGTKRAPRSNGCRAGRKGDPMKRLNISLCIEYGTPDDEDYREGQADALVDRAEMYTAPEMQLGFRPGQEDA